MLIRIEEFQADSHFDWSLLQSIHSCYYYMFLLMVSCVISGKSIIIIMTIIIIIDGVHVVDREL